jgi:hypothetical protein
MLTRWASGPWPPTWIRKRNERGNSYFAKSTLVIAAILAVICAPPRAKADDVDTAVDAIAQVGAISGIPVGPTETTIIKAIVRCAINRRPLPNCARQIIIDRLPLEASPLTACVLDGTPIDRCGAEEILRRLPAPAANAVRCITERPDVGRCGAQLVLNEAQKQAFDVIEKLKADGRSALDQAGSGTIRNIIAITEGLRDDDWVKVATAGGPEIYKVAAKTVLKVVLPAVIPASPIIDPAIDALIQSRADVVTKVIRGAKARDVRLVGEAVMEAYLIESFVVPCSIPGIPDDLKEAVCGNVGKIIHSIAKFGGGSIDLVVRLIKNPLGIPDTIWKELEGIRGTIAGKDDDCVAPEQYYSDNYSKCYHRGVQKRMASQAQLDQLIGSLNHRCRRYYDRCFFSNHFDSLCNPQRAMYGDHINKLTAAVTNAATLYSRTFAGFAASKGQTRACQALDFMRHEFQEFLDLCARSLAVQVPLPGDVNRDDCDTAPMTFSPPVVHRAACESAMRMVDTNLALLKICHPTVKPTAPLACRAEGAGRCGFLDIQCTAPLPPATNYSVAGVFGMQVFRVVPEIGLINTEYSVIQGNFTAHVCASNSAGGICSESFPITLGSSTDHSCFGPPITRPCLEGLHLCKNRCIGRHETCVPEQ